MGGKRNIAPNKQTLYMGIFDIEFTYPAPFDL